MKTRGCGPKHQQMLTNDRIWSPKNIFWNLEVIEVFTVSD